jgi:hypothetical protein
MEDEVWQEEVQREAERDQVEKENRCPSSPLPPPPVRLETCLSPCPRAIPSFFGPFDVSQFYRDKLYSDLSVVCAGGDVFRGHRVVVAATCAHVRTYLLRSRRNEEDAATVVLPDFTLGQVDALMRTLYGIEEQNDDLDVPDDLLKTLGCSYEVSQQTSFEAQEPRPPHFVGRIADALGPGERGIWDFARDGGDGEKFLCPVDDCNYGHELRKRVNNHVSVVHRKVVCPKCGSWISRKNMEQHFRSVHVHEAAAAAAKRSRKRRRTADHDDEQGRKLICTC